MPATPGQLQAIIDQQRAALLRRERAASNDIVRAYGKIWSRYNREINALVTEYYRLQDQGVEMAFWKQQQLQRLQQLRAQVEAELYDLARYADTRIQAEQLSAVQAATVDAARLVDVQAGVSVFAKLPTEALENFVGSLANGSPLRTLITSLPGDTGRAIENAITQGLALGQNPLVIARQVSKATGYQLARLMRITRTETLRAYREATRASYQRNADILTGWIWRSARSTRTCASCWAMDGTFHTFDERLDDHPNGRCFMVPVIRGIPVEMGTGVEAFEQIPDSEKLEVLGRAKYDAYKAGEIGLADLSGRKYSPEWGSMRYERGLGAARRAASGE